MKPLLLLLGLSLAANAALYLTRPSAPHSSSAPASTPKPSSAKPPASSSPTASPSRAYTAFWQNSRPDDPALADKLRAAGWSEDAIRALLIARVNDHFRARGQVLRSDPAQQEYWNLEAYNKQYSHAVRAAVLDLAQEKSALLQKLLGPSYVSESIKNPFYPDLTPAQVEALTLIEAEHQIRIAEIRGNPALGRQIELPGDREKLATLEREKAAALAKLLTPEQQLTHKMKTSQLALTLRQQVLGMAPSEQEFSAIFTVYNDFAERFENIPPSQLGNQREAMTKAKAELEPRIKQLLTPERYEDFRRSKNSEYQALYQIAERLQLRPENAIAAYEAMAELQKRAPVPTRPSDPDALKTWTTTRATLAQEAEKRLIETMGQRGYEAYRASNPPWLESLTPVRTTSPSVRP